MKRITEIVGVLGFLLAIMSLAWQIDVYLSDSIELSSSDMVTVRSGDLQELLVHTRITNTVRDSVYLRKITIKHDYGNGEYSENGGGTLSTFIEKPLAPGQELHITLKNWGDISHLFAGRKGRINSYLVVETARGNISNVQLPKPGYYMPL